jgi:hypothetical protein
MTMNATISRKPSFRNLAFFLTLALPFASIAFLASLVMILTPICMTLAPTWSVQLFYWKFESALDAWYLPIFGVSLDLCLFYGIKSGARILRRQP